MSNRLSDWVKKELRRHFTIMLIPHSRLKPLRASFTVSFLLFLFVLWTGITVWAGYLSSKHIDYWRVKTEHNLLRFRMSLLSKQLNESRKYLDQVKENDNRLRELLELKTKKAIVAETGAGGPTPEESKNLEKYLSGQLEVTPDFLFEQTQKIKRISRSRLESINEVFENLDYQRALYSATPNMRPVEGRITSGYGFRVHPVYGSYELHSGIDISAARDTPVSATAAGRAIYTGWAEGYGNLVIIEHGFNYRTFYAHLNKILCKNGDDVERGSVVGLVGDSGTSTGYHLHYEVRFNDKSINPARFLDPDNYFARKR
ncbi:MAG: M23 family metallopeptidase [Endomicrobiia bacterium]|nr:M23 family metallopeptidase [Endomicrobiia bacterium]